MQGALASTALLDHVLRHVQITTRLCSRQVRERGYVLESRTCNDWNFIYLIDGSATWVLEDTPYHLPTNHLILVPPGIPHHAYGPGKLVIASLHFHAHLPGGRDLFEVVTTARTLHVEKGSRLQRLFIQAAEEFDRDALPQMPHWCGLVFNEFLRTCAAAGKLGRGLDPVVADVLTYLEAHLSTEVTSATLAAHAGYTIQHLNRLFRRQLGDTPLRIHASMRLDRAVVLLASGERTVKAVAHAVGFADPAYFSRQFTASFGRSPRMCARISLPDSP